jgi:hypothetical protein
MLAIAPADARLDQTLVLLVSNLPSEDHKSRQCQHDPNQLHQVARDPKPVRRVRGECLSRVVRFSRYRMKISPKEQQRAAADCACSTRFALATVHRLTITSRTVWSAGTLRSTRIK